MQCSGGRTQSIDCPAGNHGSPPPPPTQLPTWAGIMPKRVGMPKISPAAAGVAAEVAVVVAVVQSCR